MGRLLLHTVHIYSARWPIQKRGKLTGWRRISRGRSRFYREAVAGSPTYNKLRGLCRKWRADEGEYRVAEVNFLGRLWRGVPHIISYVACVGNVAC